jgi:di/tricarboxylate transporter
MIDLAEVSLAALLLVLVSSCTTEVNPGFLALALAWVVAIYVAPFWSQHFTTGDLLAGFPTDLFLTLVGVTLFFTLARGNGTLDRLVEIALRGCGGNTGLVPVVFFALTLCIASIGAGNIATAALVAPLAMAAGERAKIPPFLMTIMVAHGCIAGALSPIAPTGIIANNTMARIGMPGFAYQSYGYNLVANTLAAFAGYLAFGGWRLFGQIHADTHVKPEANPTMTMKHWITLATIAMLVIGVIGFRMHVGMGAFGAAVILTLAKVTDEKPAILAIPWSVIMMVSGVTVLTTLVEKTGGIDLLTSGIALSATHRSIPSLVAFVAGLVSVFSSTAGVVLPTFLPLVPGLVAKVGGSSPLAIASSILIGGHLVDVSPLSTVGALCVASAPVTADRRRLFKQVLAWGLSMTVVGAVGCYAAFRSW